MGSEQNRFPQQQEPAPRVLIFFSSNGLDVLASMCCALMRKMVKPILCHPNTVWEAKRHSQSCMSRSI